MLLLLLFGDGGHVLRCHISNNGDHNGGGGGCGGCSRCRVVVVVVQVDGQSWINEISLS